MAKYKNKNFEIDFTVFEAKAKRLAKKLKVDEYEFVKDQTGTLAREIAKFTPPFATFPSWNKGTSVGSKADIIAGEWAIYNDIRKLCWIPDTPRGIRRMEQSAKRGGAVYGRGNKVISPGVITTISQLANWHRSNMRGRGRTRDISVPNVPMVSEALFQQYAQEKMKDAGLAKCVFWAISLKFKTKSAATPKIKRHLARVSGTGFMSKNKLGPIGTIAGRSPGLGHTLRHVPRLRKDRLIKAVKRLEYVGRQASKKAGFKVV